MSQARSSPDRLELQTPWKQLTVERILSGSHENDYVMEKWKKQHERLNRVDDGGKVSVEAARIVENKGDDGDGNEYIMISSDSEREMSPIQEEYEEAYWTREVLDVKKFCSNVMHIPAEIVEKCGLAGMSEITLNDVDNGYPYECNVKKRPKKNETYLYGEWFDYVRAAELKEGDKVHFVIYYPPVLDIMVTVERSGDRS
ncbi:uncharacterized protein LOC131646116 [Vicia villosa]|uniref:uncharacterized protein LOC131641105 n=1 Tax=Vicia villosa TaxID=3911 RepID=UPI00273B54CA|nr:uncharacterized protein LOC131641105 [Vicia villosa]XP_058772246.1 uncharacterized protein LOC131646116 [Vicia villosa]